ncbi:hypothetical protein PG996_005862 [Apiospora saccharicola]|uniref:D-serine dehydratase-like domain-containing protein n=1 Tax=Apiospora saccharicola TaxID=335842 RepID=A0ABR1VRH2_9PEZI
MATRDLLKAQYVGKSLYNVPTPALVLDLAKVEANCNLMLGAAQRLNLNWRAHIKTHKTTELTRLQVGDKASTPVNIAVSTLAEAENIVPLLKEYQESSRKVNLLFAFPIYSTCVDRLAPLSAQLGPGGLSVMVDHPDQIKHLTALASKSGNPPLVFLKVNCGSDRAGVVPDTPECNSLIDKLLVSEAVGCCEFLGVYTHTSQSYDTRSDWEALEYLGTEFGAVYRAAQVVRKERPDHPLIIAVGASPQVTSLQHPGFSEPAPACGNPSTPSEALVNKMSHLITTLKAENLTLEAHAGVYTTLDIQQLASHARSSDYLNSAALALTVLVEVVSLYPQRNGANGSTAEALINGGTLALAREPCKDKGSEPGKHYSAWGLVSPWNCGGQPAPGPGFPAEYEGWEVGRVTQEHGILTWAGAPESQQRAPLHVGQRLRVWPNHACITGAQHDWYLVVDSRNGGRKDEIVDVWPRWSGW